MNGFGRACWVGALLPLTLHCSPEASRAGASDGSPAFPSQRRAFLPSVHALGYVANRFSDTISVIDLEDFRELAAVPVGRDPVDIDGPVRVTLSKQRGRAYVLLSYPFSATSAHAVANGSSTPRSSYVQELSLANLQPLGEFRVDPRAGNMALSSDESLLAISHFDQDLALNADDLEARRANVALVGPGWEIETGSAIRRNVRACAVPAAVAYGEDESRLFVACTGEDSLVVIDTKRASVLARVPAGEEPVNKPYSLVVSPTGARLLLSNQVTRKVLEFAAQDTPVALSSTQAFEGIPYSAAYLSEQKYLVPLQSPSGAALIDAPSGTVLAHAAYSDEDCLNPSEARVLAGGRMLLVCEGDHYGPGSLVELEPDTLEVRRQVAVGRYPDHLAILAATP